MSFKNHKTIFKSDCLKQNPQIWASYTSKERLGNLKQLLMSKYILKTNIYDFIPKNLIQNYVIVDEYIAHVMLQCKVDRNWKTLVKDYTLD